METDSARTVPLGLTFDDVLLQPGESDVVPSRVNTVTRLTRNVELSIPLLSAGMDTVTDGRRLVAGRCNIHESSLELIRPAPPLAGSCCAGP